MNDSTEELHQHALSLMKSGNLLESQYFFNLCLKRNEKKFEFGKKKETSDNEQCCTIIIQFCYL
jgi:hypothetical protein